MSTDIEKLAKDREKIVNPEKNPFAVAHTQRRQAMIKILATANDDPEWWRDQLEQLTEGTGLNALAEVMKVKFSIYRNWIMGDTQREKEYANALAESRRRKLEAVDQQLFNVALNPTGYPKFADSLRAAEILRNSPAQASATGASSGVPAAVNIVFISAKDGKPAGAVVEGNVIDQVP